jgi:CheY-like chemotaxis protein
LRDTTRRVLERLGYEVIVAVDGRDALARFDEAPERIALVLTDVVMPNLGGRELYRALRDRGATLPVLLMSGYTDRDVRTADGVDLRVPLLQKPWSVADLAGHIRTMLDGRA